MQLADLPSRRNEAWKWSDLRAALSAGEQRLARLDAPSDVSPIAALAHALTTGETTRRVTIGEDGDVWTSDLPEDAGRVTRIVVPAGANGLVIERLTSWADQNTAEGLKLSAGWSDIVVEDHATLTRVVIQDSSVQFEAAPIVQLSEASVRVGAKATFRQFVLAHGASLARIETNVSVEGEGAEVSLNGLYLIDQQRHVDLTSRVEHNAPGTLTRQLVRGAAMQGGRGVFQGKFLVARAAQKTDAEMRHNALLLDQGAQIFGKPELEIYADDVKCAHGNTTGQLNEDAIFYLRQRGLPEAAAREIVTRAFLYEAVPGWLEGAIRADVDAQFGMALLPGGADV